MKKVILSKKIEEECVEKNFLLISVTFKVDSIIEQLMDNDILKEAAFGVKYKENTLEYDHILIPIVEENPNNTDFHMNVGKIQNQIIKTTNSELYDSNILYSIFVFFRKVIDKSPAFNIIQKVSQDQLGIFYTDGSFSKNGSDAGFACCKLLTESSNGLRDGLTESTYNFESFSGKIENGTNNIGELTAIKIAVENFNKEKLCQIIISDSIYGIRSYREYIHKWKKNGYKAYNKKPIKNKELIIETEEKILKSQDSSFILFKWVKGHDDSDFNEKCDELAKKEIGL